MRSERASRKLRAHCSTPDYPIYRYAKQVASGEVDDPSFLPIIFEAPADCDWTSEELWHAVNPGLMHGYPDLDGLRQLAHEARERPADREAFCQFHLGIRQEHSTSPFVDIAVYDEGAGEIDVELLRGQQAWIGVDMSSTMDLTSVEVAFRDGEDGFTLLSFFFVPKDNLVGRADRDQVPYPRWAEEGLIIATDGNAIDYSAVEKKIRELCALYDVREIAFDKAYGQPVMGPLLEDGFPVITLQQGWVTQSPALNLVERAIISRRLRHGGHPVLRWCFENAVVHTDSNGNRVLHKGKSRDRIDGAAAAWMAISRAAVGEMGRGIYDRPELWGGHDSARQETAEISAVSPSWDPEILKNPRHPEWQRHRELYEASLTSSEDEFDYA
jgi:phage terminase large subunit-like protein